MAFDPSAEPKGFLIFATGTIESAIFPLGPESSQVFCRFEIVIGEGWEHISGITNGISQAAMPKTPEDKIVFNIPFECIFRSTNPYGWPQVLVTIYGKNRWSVETTLGYSWGHLPIIGSEKVKCTEPIRVPKDPTVMGELFSWVTSRNAELKNPKILLEAYEDKDTLSLEKCGELKFTLRSICRGTNQIGNDKTSSDSVGDS